MRNFKRENRLKKFLKEFVFSRFVWSNYPYPLLVIIAFLMLIFIGYFFYKVNGSSDGFWVSVLPSAFVDVISIVISTILVSIFINLYKENKRKIDFYRVIKMANRQLIDKVLSPYLYILKHMYIVGNPEINEFQNIEKYILLNVNKDTFHKKIPRSYYVSLKKSKEEDSDLISIDKALKNYRYRTVDEIDKYVELHKNILPTDYILLLYRLKNILLGDLTSVSFNNGKKMGKREIDLILFAKKHTRYRNVILELIKYFDTIDTQRIWNEDVDEEEFLNETSQHKSVWGLIVLCLLLVIFLLFSIQVIEYFI